MITPLWIGLLIALGSALAAIGLGRNLTRSIIAGYASFAALGFSLLVANAGFPGVIVVMVGVLVLAILQIFGWMLVDVDRDHLAPTDRPTWFARSLAFVLFGGGLSLLALNLLESGEISSRDLDLAIASAAEIGGFLFGPLREAIILIGLAIAASLLAVLLLLEDDREKG